jgi:hypothetical protein
MRKAIVVAVAALLAVPQPAAAWGFDAHRFIMARAISLLPAEIRPFFDRHKDSIADHAIDPDLWIHIGGYRLEQPHHFVDLDAYGAYPFKDLPHEQDEAVKKHGREFVDKNGTLPWRTEEIYEKLVEAFTQKAAYSRDNIKYFSSAIGHYVSDAHVPFHAALNHDGQLTGQWGLHSRFETQLFERYRSALKLSPRPIVPVKNVRELMFDVLLESFPLVQPVLDADKAAVAGREFYDDRYFTMFYSRARPILERRISDAITNTASVIAAAWVEAGRPALPVEARRTPGRVRRQ